MKKNVQKKFNSKKGVTLLEIVIGITIVVIVFASTLGAMVSGYTTTLTNADHDRQAVLNASANEVLMKAVKNMSWSEADDVEGEMGAVISNTIDSPVHSAAKSVNENIYYIPYNATGGFPSPNYDFQYTIIPDTTNSVTDKTSAVESSTDIIGVTIKTYSKSSAGTTIYESFVPYKSA